jgi:hypothetical protein
MRCELILLFFLIVAGGGVVLYELRARATNRALSTTNQVPAAPEALVEHVVLCRRCGNELTDADDIGYSEQFGQGEIIHGSDGLCAHCRSYNPY